MEPLYFFNRAFGLEKEAEAYLRKAVGPAGNKLLRKQIVDHPLWMPQFQVTMPNNTGIAMVYAIGSSGLVLHPWHRPWYREGRFEPTRALDVSYHAIGVEQMCRLADEVRHGLWYSSADYGLPAVDMSSIEPAQS